MSNTLAKYQKKDLATHIYDTPDTYVGGSDLIEETLPILQSDQTIKTETFDYIPALYNIFNEILVNARDQVVRLQQTKSKDPVTTLKITIDKDVNLKNILFKKNNTEREETLTDLMIEVKEMNQLKD